MKNYLLTIFICSVGLTALAQNAILSDAFGLINQPMKAQFYQDPYLYHGGSSLTGNTQDIYKFDINSFTDQLANLSNYTYSDFGLGSVEANGFIYIIQGATFYNINLTTKARTNLQNYPSIYNKGRATVVSDGNNYIYVYGGYSGGQATNALWRYDINNNLWFQLSTAPASLTYNSGAYIYPYIYTGGGANVCGSTCFSSNNSVLRFNVIDNTWSNISNMTLETWTGSGVAQCNYEHYFEYLGELYIFIIGEPFFPLQIKKYDPNSDTWIAIPLTNYGAGFATSEVTDPIGSSSYIQKSIYIGNGNFMMTQDSGWTGGTGIGNTTTTRTLSFGTKQVHTKVNNTNCVDTLTASNLTLNYSVQLTGAFTNCTIEIKANNGSGNSILLRTLNNVSVSGQQTLSYSDIVPMSYISGNIEAIVTQGTVITKSINKYPIRKNIYQTIADNISSSNGINFCTGNPVGTILSVANVAGRTYQWYLNGSPISGQTSYQYTAAQVGTFSCLITPTNGCTIQPSVSLQTLVNPVATISPSSTITVCQGSTSTLSANTGTSLTYQWKLNGANIAGATSSTYSASQAGNYTVVVTNLSGCATTSAASTLNVNSIPNATATPAGPTSFCTGGSVTLNANTGTGLTYQWIKDGVNISGATSASYNTSQAAQYTVLVTNSSNCSATSSAINVAVSTYPSATIAPSGTISVCQGSTSTLSSNTGTSLTYQWKLNGANIAGATSSTYSASQAGNYTVVVTNLSGCATTSAASTLNVNSIPNATATPAGPTSFCTGGSVTLNANTGTGLSYQWIKDGVNISGATSASYNSSQAGQFTVLVTNSSNCSSVSNGIIVQIFSLPTPTIVANGSTIICQGETVTLTSTPSATYFWSNGAQSQTNLISQSGNYTVTVTDNNGCSNSSNSIAVVVNNQTSATQSINSLDSYTWSVNGQIYTQSGTYTHVIPNAAGCDSTITLNLTLNFTSLNELSKEIKIYPNPTKNKITIESESVNLSKFSILDAVGRIVLQGSLLSGINIIDLENLSQGTYNLIINKSEFPIRIIKN